MGRDRMRLQQEVIITETNDASAENGDDEGDDALFYDADADVEDSDLDGNDDRAGGGDGADDGADADDADVDDADVSYFDGEIIGLVGSASAADDGDCSSERSNGLQSGQNSMPHAAADAAAAAAAAASATSATSSAAHWPCLAAAGNLPSIRLGEVCESVAIESASIQQDASHARVCPPAVVPWPFLHREEDVMGVHGTEHGMAHGRGGPEAICHDAMQNGEQQNCEHEGKDDRGVDCVGGGVMGAVVTMQAGGIPPGEGFAMHDAMDGSTEQTSDGGILFEPKTEPEAEVRQQPPAQPERRAGPAPEPATKPGPGPGLEPDFEPGEKVLGQDSPEPEPEAVPGLFPNLPDDVGLDILSRLPWLNLASGRSVSRAWERGLAGEEVRELRRRSKRLEEWVFMVVPWEGGEGGGAGDGRGVGDGSVGGSGRSVEGRRGSGEGRGRGMEGRERGGESRGRSELAIGILVAAASEAAVLAAVVKAGGQRRGEAEAIAAVQGKARAEGRSVAWAGAEAEVRAGTR
ncbi:unnamed protein product [Closterium sp. Yama58-4]|nr:unnamed protein product [Closterium sp. Yama58-4]